MKNISVTGGNAWRVRILRKGMSYQVHIPFAGDKEAALQRAIAERDRFYAVLGATSTYSNTGVCGVSELTHWAHSHGTPCFSVSCGSIKKNGIRRFFFHDQAEREAALRAAVAHRARLAGEDAVQLFARAREVCCV